MKRLGILVAVVFCTGTVNLRAQLTRVANTTLNMPQTPATRGFALTAQFNNRAFTAPVALVTPPGETSRLFIVEQNGRVSLITNLTAAVPTVLTFLDIRTKVNFSGEQGLLGLAFHPNYKDNGYFYVFYVTPSPRMDRLSRFKVSATDTNLADASSELILINQADDYSNHNGGDLHFGPDGYLYVSLGDEGDGGDTGQNSQRINKDFFAGMLRIDVDKRPGNLAPNAHPAATANYSIPADNPFVGATSFNGVTLPDPTKVRTEFWATGLRNPWRFSFDPATGTLWCGDVGQNLWEEIDIIVKGGNYGWNRREGTHSYNGGTQPPGGIDPVYEYEHVNGGQRSVTGGVVYRGAKISQLYGAYIFADYQVGTVWSMRLNNQGKGVAQTLLTDSGIAAFGVDPSNGDVLVCDVNDGRIRRLEYSGTSSGTPLPQTLAATGAFSDIATLTPAAGVVPYDINLPFWSDGAIKTRWFSIPNVADKMTFDAVNPWQTPPGSVWVKHFEIEMTKGDPNSKRRLETRFIVRNANGVYGATYRWTDATTTALVPEEGADETLEIDDGGTMRSQVWRYPSRAECLACHTSAAGGVLGFNTGQMNRDFTHGTLSENQITALANAGYLNNAPASPQSLVALAKPSNAAASQEFRVRSYLDANCSQCHRPGGGALSNFDARIATPTDSANLIDAPLVNSMGDPANRALAPDSPEHSMILQRISVRGPGQMPPLASNVVDAEGVELIRSFILGDAKTRQSFTQWQAGEFANPTAPEAAAGADPDLDGAINMLEFLTGTDPVQTGDAWGLQVGFGPSGIALTFQNPANRAVIIESSSSMPPVWAPVAHPDNRALFPAVAGPRTITDAVGEDGMRWYRARIMAP